MRGVRDKIKREKIFDYYRVNADILILQETHSEKDCEEIWKNEWGGFCFFSHGNSQSRGIGVFITKKLQDNVSNILQDDDGRLVIFDLEQNEQKVSIAAIYAPNRDTPIYFKNLQDILKTRSEHKIIVGDFNLVLDIETDRLNTYHNNNNSKEVIEDLMEQFSLKRYMENPK